MKPNAYLFLVLIVILVIYYIWEAIVHKITIRTFPIRIHVNGTRGKSSVTRLIRQGLTAGGYSVFAKTTGTMARMIFPDGKEESLHRFGKPSIFEQIKVLRTAKRAKANAIVIECMALEPRYQWASEGLLIQSTHGVITNIREDHLEVMGPTLTDVTKAILSATPIEGELFVGEVEHLDLVTLACQDRNTKLYTLIGRESKAPTQEEMAQFSYWEHPENVNLALLVCESFGIGRKQALEAMWLTEPDPGAFSFTQISFFDKSFYYANALAANDPNSSKKLWTMVLERYPFLEANYILLVGRSDRMDRSIQWAEEIAKWAGIKGVFLVGQGSKLALLALEKSASQEISVYHWEDLSCENIFENLLSILPKDSMVFGVGNIVGLGMELNLYLKNRSVRSHDRHITAVDRT